MVEYIIGLCMLGTIYYLLVDQAYNYESDSDSGE